MRDATVTYPARAWVALGIFGLLMVGLLAAQLVTIVQQRDITDRQREIAQAQRDTTLGLLEDGRDLAAAVQERLPALRGTARRADGLLRSTAPLVDDLNRFDAGRALAAAGTLAAQLADQDRALAAIADIDATRAIAGETRDIAGAGLEVQRELLAIQRRTIGVLEESLAIQRETLTHVRSLDRKTGGTLPTG